MEQVKITQRKSDGKFVLTRKGSNAPNKQDAVSPLRSTLEQIARKQGWEVVSKWS